VIQLVEIACEEMIGCFHDNKMIAAWQRGHKRLDFLSRAELVITPVNEKLGLVALQQKRKIRTIHRNAQADQVRDLRIFASDAQSHQGTKTESCDQEWHTGKLRG